jgi:hypothetical protein
VAATPDGQLFAPEALAPLRDVAIPSGAEAALRAVSEVAQLRVRIEGLTRRLSGLAREATELTEGAAERALVPTTRFAPLAGSQLGGLGSFLDAPLRRHDFLAGVYEAAHAIAVSTCMRQDPDDPTRPRPARLEQQPSELDLASEDTQRCVGTALREALSRLHLERSPAARHVVGELARLELAAWLRSRTRAERLVAADPSWRWLGPPAGPPAGDAVTRVLAALTERKLPCASEAAAALCPAELRFDELLSALRAAGYPPASAAMRQALSDQELWWSTVLQRLSSRVLAVERRTGTGGPLGRTVITAASAGGLIAQSAVRRLPAPALHLDLSSVPGPATSGVAGWRSAVAHLAPYRLELDLARGGFGLAWIEPAFRATRWLSAVSVLEPIAFTAGGERWSSRLGLLATAHFAGLSLGAGPRSDLPWQGGSALGMEVRLSVLQDRLALSAGLRDVGGGRAGRALVALSFADLDGLVFWLTPLGGGR